MPSHLRIFFWLIALVCAYWVVSVVWVMLFPPAIVTAQLAMVDASRRAAVQSNALIITLASTIIRLLVFLGLAWLAAFRRQNWARWVLLIVVVMMLFAPLATAISLNRLPQFLLLYRDVPGDLVMLVLAAAIVFAFTGNARGAYGAGKAR